MKKFVILPVILAVLKSLDALPVLEFSDQRDLPGPNNTSFDFRLPRNLGINDKIELVVVLDLDIKRFEVGLYDETEEKADEVTPIWAHTLDIEGKSMAYTSIYLDHPQFIPVMEFEEIDFKGNISYNIEINSDGIYTFLNDQLRLEDFQSNYFAVENMKSLRVSGVTEVKSLKFIFQE